MASYPFTKLSNAGGKTAKLEDRTVVFPVTDATQPITFTPSTVSSMAEYVEVIKPLTKTFGNGVTNYLYPESVGTREAANGKDPKDGPGLFIIDLDGKNIDNWFSTIGEVDSFLQDVGITCNRLIVASSSAHIGKDGEDLTGFTGCHVHLLTDNLNDARSCFDTLKNQFITHGYYKAVVNALGRIDIKTPLDSATVKVNGMFFVGKPKCDNGLEKLKPSAVSVKDGVESFDASMVHPLTAEESERLATTIASENARLRDEAIAITKRLAESKINVSSNGERVDLPHDHVIYLDRSKSVTVNEILENPAAFNGRTCLDPVEPEYQRYKKVGKIYTNVDAAGNVISVNIKSQAHQGGTTYFLMGNTTSIDFAGVQDFAASVANPIESVKAVSDTEVSLEYPEPKYLKMVELRESTHKEPEFLINPYIPRREVTSLYANGGTGKTILALNAAVALATGTPFLEFECKPVKVLFYSAEDDEALIANNLKKITANLNEQQLAMLCENLRVIDASESDPILFVERTDGGVRHGVVTPRYEWLRQQVKEFKPDLLVVDNISDVYAGGEIDRPQVRSFVRAMRMLVVEDGGNGAVLLIGHVDKSTAKGDANSQSYSGSTAWNNSVRSRLFLFENDCGDLILQHQKSNRARAYHDVSFRYEGLIPTNIGNLTNPEPRRENTMALFRFLRGLGEAIIIPANLGAGTNAFGVSSKLPGYPAEIGKTEFKRIIEFGKMKGVVRVVDYQNSSRRSGSKLLIVDGWDSILLESDYSEVFKL